MAKKWALLLCGTVAAVSLVDGRPVWAQTGQAAGATATNFEEVVVTARRKEERIQSVPIAITAFSQADLEKKQITKVQDLTREVPSLSTTMSQSDANTLYSSQFRLRGLPGSVIYFNDVPIGSTDLNPVTGIIHSLSPGYFYDLDHLEVDKGPQGTLFGKNSVGGLISFQPKAPTQYFEGYGKFTLGDYNDKEFEGAVNVPLIQDKLLLRVSGSWQQRDGYTKDLENGKDLDNIDYYSWRIGLTMRPTDDIENYFLYDGYYQHTNGSAEVTRYVNPNFTLAATPIPGINAKFGGVVPITLGNGPSVAALSNPATEVATYLQLLQANAAGKEATLSFFPNLSQLLQEQQKLGARTILGQAIQGLGKDYFYGFTDKFTWNINDDLTVKNIAAARIYKELPTDDFNGLGIPILTVGDPKNNTGWVENDVQYTEELQILGKALGDRLSWIAGGFLQFDHPLGASLYEASAVGQVTYDQYHNSDRSQALFAHGIYDLSDYIEGLRFTGGYRYTWDYISVGEASTTGSESPIRGPGGLPTNCGLLVGSDNNCFTGVNAHYSSYGWNLSLDYQVVPSTLLYVRAGNAYRAGSVNLNVTPQFDDIKPEHVTDVELGVKSDWELFGIQARTNADIFHTDYKAIQVTQTINVSSGGRVNVENATLNAASAELEGFEFEGTFVPFKGIEISPRASYIYAYYDKYPTVFGALLSASKPPFVFVPKWQYGVTGTYHLPVDQAWGDIAVSLDYSWVGHQYYNLAAGEIFPIMPSYENVDLKVDWTDVFGSTVDLGAFVSNLTDNTHIAGLQTLYTALGFTAASYNPPRMFGFSLKYRFHEDNEVSETAGAYVPPPVQAPAPAPRSYLVFFDFNKSDLTSQATEIVDTAAKNAGPAKVTQLTVTGHTDTVGSDAYNMRLSRRRAESVAAQLEKDGIAGSEIEIVAKGKRDLLVPTKDGVREPQNRRVQIVYDGRASS
jgi:iron complex outermembrane receptor protein